MFTHSHGNPMYLTAAVALLVMAVTFVVVNALGRKFRQKIPLAVNLFVCMITGSLASGFGIPFRHLFEGPVWFIYINLVIICGMIFLTFLKAAGNLDSMAYDILSAFKNRPSILFCLVALMLFFPGMCTGVGTAAVLSTGLVAIVILRLVGIPDLQVAAIVAMLTTIGAAAPPINLPALIITSGINMPYDGFTLILFFLTVPLGLFSIFWLGWKHYRAPDQEAIDAAIPNIPRRFFLQPYMPLIVVIAIFALIRIFPGQFPDIVTPMVFVAGSVCTLFSGKKFRVVAVSREAIKGGIFSTVALLFVVGTVVQIITLTGVKGLLVLGALELGDISRLIIYVVMGVSLPLMGGVLTHLGGAVILGIPFTLALLDQNIVAVVAAASMLGVLSQVIPPSALGGYFAQELVGIPRYSSMLRLCTIPLLVSILFSMVVLYFANEFAALLVPF
jgi:hypothetical protein